MKKFTQSIVMLIAAIAVFFTGAGVTIINYCCSNCEAEQTLIMASAHDCCSQKEIAVEHASCCSAHTSTTEENTGSNTCNISNSEHCKVTRLSSDIEVTSARQHLYVPYIWISDLSPSLSTTIVSNKIEDANKLTEFESPPEIPPREYLSLISVLII